MLSMIHFFIKPISQKDSLHRNPNILSTKVKRTRGCSSTIFNQPWFVSHILISGRMHLYEHIHGQNLMIFTISKKKVMNNATLLTFTMGFNVENQFFSHCKKSNIDLYIKPCKI